MHKNSKVMVRRERKFYTTDFKARALEAYHNSDESVSMIAQRFGIGRDTFSSWVYRGRISSASKKSATLSQSNSDFMKKEALSSEAMLERINSLERELSLEKMRSESLSKMIEIVERELHIDIRKKTGAKQSLR